MKTATEMPANRVFTKCIIVSTLQDKMSMLVSVCVYIKNSFVLEDLYKQNIFAVSCYVML
jgi:hypothetical protein